MLIYVGKLTYSPYASDELITVVFRDNVQNGDKVVVMLQWTKDSGGKAKANFSNHGTVNNMVVNGSGDKQLEIFSAPAEKEANYYWFKGKVSGQNLTLTMSNKSGEEVAKDIQLKLFYF
ncbi:hypothetical protein N7493_008456 [Penicillium malachiteum]|uniref:Uncharacterized protein n=1 Tax=Penicillium malachiteum TaxID=1324776 RepID=A0AAD6MTZ1_9EURO|nr:hypothetical protein N7493_008456 [Penicillium malachiteum]